MASFFNWLPWLAVGDFANVAQLSGVNAVQLIAMVVKAANNARMHKANCRQFAQHLKLISNLLQKLNLTDLKKRPESREPLELLEQALRKAVLLVESCRDKSYLYLVAMGWVYVSKFRDFQDEIDRYLKLIPLISLVENTRERQLQERLKDIERDHRLYTMEKDEVKVQEALLKPERTHRDSLRASRQLSRRYPGLPLDKALRSENAKLRKELDHMRACMELDQCDVIKHLIDFTEETAADPVILEEAMHEEEEDSDDETVPQTRKVIKEKSQRHITYPKPSLKGFPPHQKLTFDGVERKDPSSYPSSPNSVHSHYGQMGDWHHDIFDCCIDPCLCMDTFCYPCDTFANVASSASDGEISPDQACHNLAFHTLYGGCYCYTCCVRRKVRQRYNIPGDVCGDYWVHACCCCCAVLQEWHEIRVQEEESQQMVPPIDQVMDDF